MKPRRITIASPGTIPPTPEAGLIWVRAKAGTVEIPEHFETTGNGMICCDWIHVELRRYHEDN